MADEYKKTIKIEVDAKQAEKELNSLEKMLNGLTEDADLKNLFSGDVKELAVIQRELEKVRDSQKKITDATRQNAVFRQTIANLRKAETYQRSLGANKDKEALKMIQDKIKATESLINANNEMLEQKAETEEKPNKKMSFVKGFFGRGTDQKKKWQERITDIDAKLKDTTLTDEESKNLKSERDMLDKNVKSINAGQKAFQILGKTIKNVGNIAHTVFKAMGIDLKSIMTEVISNITSALNMKSGMATWNTGSSLITNSQARETRMKYGLSDNQAYALTQTMQMLGMSTNSDEDLMYMNQQQKQVFNELMNKYDSWYTEFKNSGAAEELQRAQLEFAMFKQEISYKLLNWFAEHRDTIMNILNFVMDTLENIFKLFEWLLNILPFSKSSSKSSATSSDNYGSSTVANNNTNVYVTNTNNATANLNSKSELDTALNNSNADLVKRIASSIVK